MKNLHVLPTDHPSRLRYNIKTNFWELNEFHKYHTDIKSTHNIYITSEEDIKEGGWHYNLALNIVEKTTNFDNGVLQEKIILTTDPDLIKYNVQAINDEVLEWFVKNSNCEFVETERLENGRYVDFLPNGDTEEGVYENYKIIIPKEELYNETQQKSLEFNKSLVKSITTEELDLLMSKFDDIEPKQREMFLMNANTVIYTRKPKQGTLEEAAKNYAIDNSLIGYELMPYKGFIEGAKWQQERSYSEDEVKTIINDIVEKHCAYFKQETKDVVKLEWFERFKK